MPKQYNINWRDSDRQKIKKAITNFNQRLYRQKRANPNADWLPATESYNHAIETIKTRADFNKYIRQLERFNAKNAEKGQNTKLELRQAVNRFNKVRESILQNNPSATYLPSERSYDELSKTYKSQKDMKRMISSLNKFNEDTAQPVQGERGKISQWLLDERNQRVPIINEKRAKLKEEIGELPFTSRGKEQGYPVKEAITKKDNSLEPVTSDPLKLTAKQVDEQFKWMDRALNAGYDREKRSLWQRNYIKGLMRVGMPQDVIDLLTRVDPDTFAKIIDSDSEASISFIYDINDLNARAENIRNIWSDHDTGKTQTKFNLDDIANEIEYEAQFGYVGRKYTDDQWYKPYAQVRKSKGYKK